MAASLRWARVQNGGIPEVVACSKWHYICVGRMFIKWRYLWDGRVFQMAVSLRWSCVPNGGTSEMVAGSKWRHLWDGLLVKMAASPRWSQVLSWLRVSPRDVVRLTTVKNYIMGKSNNKQRQTQPARAAEQECQHLLSRYSQVCPRYSYIIVGQKEDDQERFNPLITRHFPPNTD